MDVSATVAKIQVAVRLVYAELGPGRPELAYSAALAIELGGVHQVQIPVMYKDTIVSISKADVVLNTSPKTVIEVKLGTKITPDAISQVSAYARSICGHAFVVLIPKVNTPDTLAVHNVGSFAAR